MVPETDSANQLALSIPDDIAEEDDDDEFVVASAASECGPKTILSPPPMSRHKSTNTLRRLPYNNNESVITLQAATQQQSKPEFTRPRYPLPSTTFYYKPAPKNVEDETPTSRFSFSSDEGSTYADDDDDDEVDPLSPARNSQTPSFTQSDAEEDDDNDDDQELDCLSPPINFKRAGINMGRRDMMEQSLAKAFEGYRLPRSSLDDNNNNNSKLSLLSENQNGEASVVNSPPLLALPIMDDFTSDLKSAGLF